MPRSCYEFSAEFLDQRYMRSCFEEFYDQVEAYYRQSFCGNTREQRAMRSSHERLRTHPNKLKKICCRDLDDEQCVYNLFVSLNNAHYYYTKSDIKSYNAAFADYIRFARNSSNHFIEFVGIILRTPPPTLDY